MSKKRSFQYNGETVDVEEQDVLDFIKAAPEAKEVKSYILDGDTVDVALPDVKEFEATAKNATPLYSDEEVKKKGSESSGSGVHTDGEKNPYAPNTEIDFSSLQDKKSPGTSILSDAKNSAPDSPFVQSLKPKVSAIKNLQDSAAKAAEQERLKAEKERKASVLVNQLKKEPTPKGYKPDDVGMETYADADKAYMAEQNAKIEVFIKPKLAEIQKQYSDEREQDPKYIEAMAPIKQQIDAYSQELIAKAQKVVVDNHITDKAKIDEMNGEINKAVNEYAQKLNDESPEIKKVNGYYNDKIKSDIDEYIKKEYKPKTKYFGNGEPIEPFISAIKSESFGILSQNEKKTIIASMWDKINTRLEQKGTSPKTIAEAKQEFMWYALSAATHNENGGISQFALREMATKMKVALEEEYKNTEDERKLLQEHTKDLVNANSMSKEDRAIYDKTTKIENSIKNIDAVLSTPDGDINAWLAFGKGFASEAGLPFIKSLNEISTGIDTYKISQKMLKKQPLTPEEATYMKTVGMADAIRAEMPNSSLYNIGAGVAGSLVFLGEFALLNPIGAAVEEGSANVLRLGLKGAGNKVKQAAYKEAIATQLAQAPIKFTKPLLYEALVVKPLSTLIGATAQTLASPHQVINNTIRRMTPQALVMFSPEVNDLVTQLNTDKFNIQGYRTGHNEPMSEALPRGFAQAFTEIFTEKMFTGLSGVSDLATRGLMTRLAKDIPTAQKMYVAYMMSKYKLRVDQVDDFLKNSGLPVGGSIEEFGEEIGSGLLTPWLTGDGKPLGDWYDSEKGFNWKTIGETAGVIAGQSLLFRGLGAAATMGKGKYVDLRVTDGQTTFTSPISQKGFEFIGSSLKGKDKEYIKAWAATHITSFSEKEQLAVKALINHLAKEKIFQTHKGKMVPDIYGVNQQAPPPTPGQTPPPPTPEQQAAEDFDTKERKRGNTGYTIQNQDGTIETPDEQELLEWLAVPANLRALEQGQSTLQADNPSDEVSAVLVEFAKHGSAIATPDGAVTAAKHNGKYVKYKGELGVIHVDEGGKITVETPDKIYDIQGNATDDLAEHGIEPISARPAGSATQAPPAAPVPAAPAAPAAGSDEAISTDAERLRGTTTGETLAAEFANEQDPYDAMSRAYHQALGIPINKRTKAQHRLIAGVEEAFAEKDKAPDPPSDKVEPNVVNDEDGYNISAFKVGDIIERDDKRYEILGNSKKENTGIVKLRSLDSGAVSDWNAENNGGFKLAKEDKPSGEKPTEGVDIGSIYKSPETNYTFEVVSISAGVATLKDVETGKLLRKKVEDLKGWDKVELDNENNAEDDKEVGDGAVGNYNPKFKTATKVKGEATTIEMPNGETREAEFMVVESDDILASHNEISFNDTEGFPKTKDGRNANSRNYKGDKSAQLKVNDDAANLKSSIVISDAATPDTGVPIISEDGIVLSGNGRTMAIKLSQNIAPEKYQAYKADLLKRAAKFGIDPSEVAKMKKPILVKVDKSVKDYSVKTFDEYNGKSQKEESPIDKAIKRSAIIQNDESLKERILSVIGRHETMTDLFENKSDRKELFDLLVANNIILKQETPKYVGQNGEFTNDGKDLINDVLIATILSPETLEATNNVKAFRNKIINALPVLSVNYKLGSNSLEAEVNDAIMLQSRIAAMGSQDDFWKHLRQMGMFDAVNPNTVIINRMINNGAKDFKKFIVAYNKSMEVDEHNLFGGDVVLTKQQVIDNLKESNLSENEKQIIANLEELYNANEQKGPIGNDEVVGGGTNQNIHAQDYADKRMEAKTAYERELEQALEELSKAYAEARGNEAALKKLTENTPKTARAFIKRLTQGTTPESVAESKAALVEIQRKYAKEKAEMRQGIPRERGTNFIIEKLSRAARNGDISQETADLAIDLLRMAPGMFEDLAISISQNKNKDKGGQGWYRAADALVKIFKNPVDPTTAAHELLHHTERFMPYDVRAGIVAEWQNEVNLQIAYFKGLLSKETDAKKRDLYSKALMYLALAQERSVERNYQNAEDMKSIMLKYLSDHTDSQGNFHQGLGQSFYQLLDASEWWAVNASRLMQEAKNKPELKTWIDKAKAFLNGLIKAAKKIFKGSPTQAVEDGIKAIMDGRMLENREGGMLADSAHKIGAYAKGTNSNMSAQSGNGGVGGDVEMVNGFYTPSKNTQSSKMQSSGLPTGKFIALDAPFTSTVHDAKDAQKIQVNLKGKKVYNPDGVKGFKPTENLGKELSVFANEKIKEGKKSFEELMTEFYQSKGYDAYVRLIDGGMRNNERELILFDRNTPLTKQEQSLPTQEQTPEQQMADAKAELARAWKASGYAFNKNAGQNLGFMYDPAVDIKRQGDLFKALYNVAKLAIQQAANKLLAINATDFIASIRGYGKLYADITDAHLTDVFNEAKKAFEAKEKDQSLVDPQMSQRAPNRAALAHDLVERVKAIYAKFGIPIAEQKLFKARGFFQSHPEIVKISSMFNVAVGAHELMHYVIKKHAMVKQALTGPTAVSNQLKDIYINHYPGAKDTHAEELQIEEGMTMLMNLWVQNPAYAQQMYGDAYYAMFDPAGSLYNNDVHDMAMDFAEIIEDYLGLPANERIGARIRWGQPGMKKRSLHHNAYNFMKYQIYDKLYLAKDVDRMLGNEFSGSGIAPNIAMMNTAKTRMQHWFVRSRLANTRAMTVGTNGNWKEARYNTTVSDYMDLFHDKKSGLTIEEFNQMLVARRQLSDYRRLDRIDADVANAKKMIETLETDNKVLEAQIAVETDRAILQSLKVQLSANLQNIDNHIKNISELTEDALKTSEILERNRISRPFAEEVMGLLENKYAEPARMFDEVQANVVDMMEATGMVSAERANEWRGKDGYASFRRYLDDEEKLRESLVDAVGANGVKQLTSLFPYKGSDLPLLPATYSQALAINEAMMKGTRNMMWQAWANAAANNKDVARMFRERTNSEGHRNDDIAVWVNGKKKFYQASAEVILFANAIQDIQPDKIEEVGRAIAKMLQVSVTGIYLPFALVNLSVDAFTRAQLSETKSLPVINDIATIYRMLESPVKILVGQILGKEFDPNIIDEYISMGGKASLNINLHNISAEGVMKQFLAPTVLDKAKLAADMSVEALSLAVNLTELMGRATEYRRAIAKGDPTNVAMMKAQNVAINWRQRGSFGNTKGGHSLVTKLLNTIAYSFAQITAFNQVVAGAKRHPVKTASLVALITAVYAATQYLIYAWGDDDEKREMANQPVEMLPKFIYLPNSVLFGPGSSGLTKIRIPELLAFPGTHFALGARSAYLGGLKGANTKPKDIEYFSWKNEEQLTAGTLPPMMYPNFFVTKTGQDGRTQYPRMNTFGSSLIPTAVKTESEVISGMKTYPSEMPIIPNYMTSWQTKYQYDKYTTETAKCLARVLDWSPKMLDYYITQKTGRGVKMMIELGEYAFGKKDELNLYNPTQVDDRFFFSGELSNSFYDKANIALHEKNIKKNDLTITDDDASLANLYDKGMKVLSQTAKATMTKTDKQIDALQLYLDKMEGSPKLTQDEKVKLKRGELTQAQKAAVYNVWAASYNDDMIALEKAIIALDALNNSDPLFAKKYESQYFINASPEAIEKQ